MEANVSKALKWILGILGVLIVVAVVVGVGFLAVSHWGGTRWMMSARSFEPYEGGRVNPWRNSPQFEMPMHPNWGMPMAPGTAGHRGRFPLGRFGGFFPLGLIFGALFWGAVVFFVVLGVIYLFRGRNKPQAQSVGSGYVAAATAVPATPQAPIVEETVSTPAEAPAQEAATCPNCGQAVQAEWSHCPHCGQKLK
jgi:hypothetical protein